MNTKFTVAYLCFYMHKMYEEVEKMQENENYKWNDMYFIDEKLYTGFNWIKDMRVDQFIKELESLTLEQLKDEHYMNIS